MATLEWSFLYHVQDRADRNETLGSLVGENPGNPNTSFSLVPLRHDPHLKILHINLHTFRKEIVERVSFEDQTHGIIELNVLHR